jgi:pilus assembly protein Flp/PilA
MRGGDSGDFILGKHLIRFLNNESGATAIESGLIAAGISVAIIAVVAGLGTSLNTAFGGVRCYFCDTNILNTKAFGGLLFLPPGPHMPAKTSAYWQSELGAR